MSCLICDDASCHAWQHVHAPAATRTFRQSAGINSDIAIGVVVVMSHAVAGQVVVAPTKAATAGHTANEQSDNAGQTIRQYLSPGYVCTLHNNQTSGVPHDVFPFNRQSRHLQAAAKPNIAPGQSTPTKPERLSLQSARKGFVCNHEQP